MKFAMYYTAMMFISGFVFLYHFFTIGIYAKEALFMLAIMFAMYFAVKLELIYLKLKEAEK